MGTLTEYKEKFYDFLVRSDIKNIQYGDETLLFYLNPLVGTPWPWWMIAYALLCNRYGKKNIVFLLNDCWNNGHLIYSDYDEQTRCIREICSYLGQKGYTILSLNSFPDAEYDSDLVEKAAELSTIWFMGSSYKGTGYVKCCKKWCTEFKKIAPKLTYANKNMPIKKWVLVSGVVYDGYLMYQICQRSGNETWAYDAVQGSVFEKNGIGVQLLSLNNSYNVIRNNVNLKALTDKAICILNNRIGGLDDIGNMKGFCFQSQENGKNLGRTDYVIFPNDEADGSSMGADRVFKDDFEWLHQTIDFILKNTDKVVTVRQHPALRLTNYAADVMRYSLKEYKDNRRVIIHDCYAEINSYHLIKQAEIVMVHNSTIGMEAAYMGKRVIAEAESFYTRAGLVEYYSNKEEYFNSLLNNNIRQVSDDDKKKLLCLYGLRQLCGSIAEKFTIEANSFVEWIQGNLDSIYEDDEVKILVRCLCNDERLVEQKFMYEYGGNKQV